MLRPMIDHHIPPCCPTHTPSQLFCDFSDHLLMAIIGKAAGLLFQLENGQPLRHCTFTTQVQQALIASGVDGSLFNSHSFCIGAATTASAAGVPETTIKHLGRRRSSTINNIFELPPQTWYTFHGNSLHLTTSIVLDCIQVSWPMYYHLFQCCSHSFGHLLLLLLHLFFHDYEQQRFDIYACSIHFRIKQ